MDDNTKYHFDQDRSLASQKGNNSTYNILKSRFEALMPYFQKAGLEVYNCNSNSDLKVFPYKSFEEAVHIATAEIPDITTERTAGLYERKAAAAKVENTHKNTYGIDATKTTFTDDDKAKIKRELDIRRKNLHDIKHQLEMYKLMPDKTQEHLYTLEASVQKARASFRACEQIKNKVWGITQ
jgi:hypothetical protein